MITQVLKYFFSASDIMEAVRGRFCFNGMKVAKFKSHIGMGQQAQAQCNSFKQTY